MIKKFLFSLLLCFCLSPLLVSAGANTPIAARIGDNYYETLEEAIAASRSTDTIVLASDVVLDETLEINKTVNINLNGNDITAPTMVFQVQGGALNITGKGTIRELEPNYGAIMVKGSTDPNDTEYTVVKVGSDVTLEGWSGVFINHDSSKAYGVVVKIAGKINAVDDINGGSGIGVYVNGKISDQNNYPIVNILDGAEITSTGNGLYIAGYSVFNIGDAYISGVESGIAIKAGALNIDGATVVCTGKDSTPTEGYNNGINASGSTIQIESNSGYAGNIELNIKDGNFTSKYGNVIYEYIGKGNNSLVDSINISGGTFTSETDKNVFLFSDSFKNNHSDFVTGGKYSSDPSSYLESGYKVVLENDLYSVVSGTMKQVFFNSDGVNSNNFGKGFIGLIVVAISVVLIYFNRIRILSFIERIINRRR